MMLRKHKLLIVLMLAIGISDAGLATLNLSTSRDNMMAAQQDRLRALRDGFDIALYNTELKLTEIATFVSEVAEIRLILRQGQAALVRADGDSHAPKVEDWRMALINIVGPRWTRLQFNYLLRQLGFYLSPNLTAFYRAEAPHLYGDSVNLKDSLVATVAATQKARAGFDIDGLSTGVRAAVPIIIDNQPGVIEAGSSLDSMLIPICPNTHCGAAVLLDRQTVTARMTPSAIEATFTPDRRVGDWMVEASTNPAVTRALLGGQNNQLTPADPGRLAQVGARWYAMAHFPLRDHLGKDDPSRLPSGQIMVWLDVDEAVRELRHSEFLSIALAVAAFAVISLLMYLSIELVTDRLEGEISRRTSEVQTLLKEVSFLAEHDPLTGLYNRRVFNQRLREEIARGRRIDETFSLISIDVDHFKRINDQYGHPTGDQALRQLSAVIADNVRTEDVAARIGGEEFAILLPHTDISGALTLAQRLKDCFIATPIPTPGGHLTTITFSAGVTTWRHGVDEAELLREVDRALYRAKNEGRNRIIIASQTDCSVAGNNDVSQSEISKAS